jgi:hypothetical protein
MRTLVRRPKGRFTFSGLLSFVAIAGLALTVLLPRPDTPVVVEVDQVVTGSTRITVRMHSAQYKEELEALTRNIYFEARSLHFFDQAMVAHITLNRVRANKSYWGGNTIAGVVYHKRVHKNGRVVHMHSWTKDWPKGTHPKVYDEVAWKTAAFIAAYVLDGKFVPPAHLADADSFLNPRISDLRNVCEFKRNLIVLEEDADHHYYRAPRGPMDKLVLSVQPTPKECANTQVASR